MKFFFYCPYKQYNVKDITLFKGIIDEQGKCVASIIESKINQQGDGSTFFSSCFTSFDVAFFSFKCTVCYTILHGYLSNFFT